MKSFKYWTKQDLLSNFGLDRSKNCQVLEDWIENIEEDLDQKKIAFLDRYRTRLIEFVDSWNEQELSMNFVGPLIAEIDFYTEHTNFFYGRKIAGKINGEEISGYVDGMISEGKYAPNKPYFCLHEYKYEEGASNDGTGQLVIAMYLAQIINGNDLPVYGAYVLGRNWFFVTLTKEGYCKSKAFDCTEKDSLQQIYLILKRLKNISVELAIKHQTLQAN